MKLVNKKSVGQRRVYDIEVADVHNFYANGINVHNCATDGGVSVIKDDGTVVDDTTFSPTNTVEFGIDNDVFFGRNGFGRVYKWDYSADTSSTAQYVSNTTNPPVAGNVTGGIIDFGDDSNWSTGSTSDGLNLFVKNTLAVNITSEFNTGWMNGDIKLATLSDTDDTDVTGSELVTNGTFDTDTDWVKETAAWSIAAGVASCDGTQTAGTGLYQDGVVTPGSRYVLTFDLTVSAGSLTARFGQPGGLNLTGFLNSSQTVTVTGVAPSSPLANTRLVFIADPNFVGTVDNVSVRLAEPDRSVNGNGLAVYGTITKDPVATGADLVAYSGFSVSNYLEQPYNSDLDFGTGDFCMMGWVKTSGTTTQTIFDLADLGRTGQTIFLGTFNGDFSYRIGSATTVNASAYAENVWIHVALLRSNGVAYLYVNGVLDDTVAASDDLSNPSAVLYVGLRNDVTRVWVGSLALLRISATAPTAEQIAKIYEDEKFLFQENAQATLYGSSDAVTALAHDEVTDLLHVGTSAGRSVFQGLRRVDNTTDAVGVAISAYDDLVVED